jgi:hypothetical protein
VNQIQFEQWKDFSSRAVNVLFITESRKQKLKTNIAHFFEEVSINIDFLEIERWEDVMDLFYDYFEDFRVNHEKEKTSSFQSQLHAVIRAGINAVTNGWGVIDWFTAGDVKAMFEDKVPTYVTDRFIPEAFEDDKNILDF